MDDLRSRELEKVFKGTYHTLKKVVIPSEWLESTRFIQQSFFQSGSSPLGIPITRIPLPPSGYSPLNQPLLTAHSAHSLLAGVQPPEE